LCTASLVNRAATEESSAVRRLATVIALLALIVADLSGGVIGTPS